MLPRAARGAFFRFANLSHTAGVRHAITTRWRPVHPATDEGNGSTDKGQPPPSVDLLDYPPSSPLPPGGAGGGRVEFNLGYRATDFSPRLTAANWRYLTAALGIAPELIVAARQVHGNVVARVGGADGGAGIRLQAWGAATDWRDHDGPTHPPVAEADGLCTDEARVWLMNVYADCTPLLFYDPRHRAVAVAHAGWRGTVAGIGANVVAKMHAEFATQPADLLCGIGPAAGPCCYQVGGEVIAAVQAAFPRQPELLNHHAQPEGHAILDLWAANRLTLEQAGVPAANIELAGICTIHQSDQFFSARRDQRPGLRFAALIGIE